MTPTPCGLRAQEFQTTALETVKSLAPSSVLAGQRTSLHAVHGSATYQVKLECEPMSKKKKEIRKKERNRTKVL